MPGSPFVTLAALPAVGVAHVVRGFADFGAIGGVSLVSMATR